MYSNWLGKLRQSCCIINLQFTVPWWDQKHNQIVRVLPDPELDIANTVKPLNNGPPEERQLVNNGQILIALVYFNTFATLMGSQKWPNSSQFQFFEV